MSKCFEIEQVIEQQNLGYFRIITIKNCEKFQLVQNSEQAIEQLLNNERTPTEHLVNTYKNEKNEKNTYMRGRFFQGL